MKILVTGGAGYIGSVIVDALVERGHETVVLDDLSKGHEEAVSSEARLVKGSVLDHAAVRSALSGVQAVVHMAASSLVPESVCDPALYFRNNTVAGLVLLDAMRSAGVSRLVFSSTAAVYGEPERTPILETDRTEPTNPYGASKLAVELALRAYGRAYGLRSCALRYFNAAGASQTRGEDHDPETHLIPLLLQAAAGRRGPVTLYGEDYPTPDGTCVRDYVHVSDLAEAHVLALDALDKREPGCESYNIGCGGAGYSVKQVLDAAKRVTGKDIPHSMGPRRAGDPAVLVASSEKLRAAFGFKPRRQELDEIIGSAWRWMSARART